LTAPERFDYPLPEAFSPPFSVASVYLSPRPELPFSLYIGVVKVEGAARDDLLGLFF
jgi:hypothetical protein